ncbi:hypothetical protein [Rhodopseudomonas sp. AAP120]|uniref:hypothetical protein n=1 Tax=Rhodopseudomonas sp. AAP120 TaxID=1523430 RepID=UPI0012E30EDA|nr:hypothetical protein [Rhodopseudomonas sp. AAP120]
MDHIVRLAARTGAMSSARITPDIVNRPDLDESKTIRRTTLSTNSSFAINGTTGTEQVIATDHRVNGCYDLCPVATPLHRPTRIVLGNTANTTVISHCQITPHRTKSAPDEFPNSN